MADETTLNETAQALFCSLSDYAGAKLTEKLFDKTKYSTYTEFRNFWNSKENPVKGLTIEMAYTKRVDAPNVTFKMLENHLTEKPDWFLSSMLIAKKLMQDIQTVSAEFNSIKQPKWSDIFYVRGDKPVMKTIQDLFTYANETQKALNSLEGSDRSVVFGDINKWSPADIYFATESMRKKLDESLDAAHKSNKRFTFTQLNKLISDGITKGELLPLSLKKQTKQVTLQKVNFSRAAEIKKIGSYGYFGVSDWKEYKKSNSNMNTKTEARDLKIYFEKTKRDQIKIRHDASTAVLKAEYLGADAQARGGSIGSVAIFSELIGLLDPTFSKKFLTTYTKGNATFKSEVKKLGPKPANAANKAQFDKKRGELSAIYVTNAVIPLLMDWLKKGQRTGRSDEFIRLIYQYITSRTVVSSKFVIAK
jgi:hypothetical protein